MKVEAKLFYLFVPFYVIAGIVYGFLTNWTEWVGFLGMPLVGGLTLMIGSYLGITAKRVGLRPEDQPDAEVHEGAGQLGEFSPWSWWPIAVAASAGLVFMGLAVGWWVVFIGVGAGTISVFGWIFEYTRGDHAH